MSSHSHWFLRNKADSEGTVLLLGASGYIGRAFADELRRRRCFFVPLTRSVIDYTQFVTLFEYVQKIKPAFVINAAGFTGNPNVDVCESDRTGTLSGNVLLPQTIARVCLMTNTPWGHVSSGGIYNGAKVIVNGELKIEEDMTRPEFQSLFAEHPHQVLGFTEQDEPNFSFIYPPCNFYSGTKALAEETIRDVGDIYIWRPGILFNERDEPRNYLSQIQRDPKVYDSVNSMSHLADFIRACLDLWERRVPFGVYNVTNPGAVSARQIVDMIQRTLKLDRRFEFWRNDEEFCQTGNQAPRSNCILDVSKLLATGVRLRPVEKAMEESLQRWSAVAPALRLVHSS